MADLFYNLPARRKFLKSDTAEATQVSRLVDPDGARLSGSWIHADQRQPDAAGVSAGRRRCPSGSFSSSATVPISWMFARKLAACRSKATWRRLGDQGPVRGAQNVFVNRRIVKDRTIAHAISEAYSVATIKERSPEVHLFLRIAPDRVDVNVHPTKAEVRFLEQSLVHEVLRRALADALGQGHAPGLQLTPAPAFSSLDPRAMTIPGVLAGASVGNRWWEGVDAGTRDSGRGTRDAGCEIGDYGSTIGTRDERSGPRYRPMIPLGQFRDTFIVAVDDEGVAIVDQHVAHERVLFEQVMERLTSGRLESQRLLTPIFVELSASQRQALLQHAANAGEVRPGGRGVRRRQPPAVGRAGAARRVRERGGGSRPGRGPRRPRSRLARRRRAAPHRGDHGLPCRR